jgi:predicted metal-dependent hydrolase
MMTINYDDTCNFPLHPQAVEGFRLFNAGKYFEAHEALEDAWKEEQGKVRDLYRGILQIAVVYLHVTRGNYNGALKVYARSMKWLKDWPDLCRGVYVEELRKNAENVIREVQKLGVKEIGKFDIALLKPLQWDGNPAGERHTYICDKCGHQMDEKNCKVTCPNCGNRFDCSDLNIYFD